MTLVTPTFPPNHDFYFDFVNDIRNLVLRDLQLPPRHPSPTSHSSAGVVEEEDEEDLAAAAASGGGNYPRWSYKRRGKSLPPEATLLLCDRGITGAYSKIKVPRIETPSILPVL